MNRIAFILAMTFLGIYCNGCSNDYTLKRNNIDVVAIGSKEFPKELVGNWVSDQAGWGISVEIDGTIKSIVHPLGHCYIEPGKENTYPLIDSGKGLMIPGKWTLQYTKKNRELVIEIVIDHFSWTKGPQQLEGNSRDVLYGIVSDDYKTWRVTWDAFPEYHVRTESVNDVILPVDESLIEQGTFVFDKRQVQ